MLVGVGVGVATVLLSGFFFAWRVTAMVVLITGTAVGLGVTCGLLAWLFMHTIFTLRYAHQPYSTDPPPIDLNQEGKDPRYSDIAYLAFGVGTAFQVSDTALRSPQVRRSAMGHSLGSFQFAAAILGIIVNLVGLARQLVCGVVGASLALPFAKWGRCGRR